MSNKLLAVKSPSITSFRNEILVFDCILIFQLEKYLKIITNKIIRDILNPYELDLVDYQLKMIEKLAKAGIVSEYPTNIDVWSTNFFIDDNPTYFFWNSLNEEMHLQFINNFNKIKKSNINVNTLAQEKKYLLWGEFPLHIRAASLALKSIKKVNCYPLFNNSIFILDASQTILLPCPFLINEKDSLLDNSLSNKAENTLKITVKDIPIPEYKTELELLLDFRNDANTRKCFLALKQWFEKIIGSNLLLKEINENLENIINKIKKKLEFWKIGYSNGRLETFIPTSIIMNEYLKEYRFTDKQYMFYNNHIALSQSEKSEIAYVIPIDFSQNIF